MKLSELLADRGRLVNRLPVPVLLSTEAAERLTRAQGLVKTAEREVAAAETAESGRMDQPRTRRAREARAEAEDELAEARDAAVPHLVDFVVESVGSDEWEALVAAHPPTDDQRERLKDPRTGRAPEFDPIGFSLAAVAACLVEPEVVDLDDVKKLKASVPDIVWQQIFAAVLKVNRGENRVDPSWLDSGTTTGSVPGSEPQSS